MSLAAINEQLLRAVGVGISLFETESRTLVWRNEVFETWFPDLSLGETLTVVFGDVDPDKMAQSVEQAGRHSAEISVKRKRRTLVLSLVFSHAQIGDTSVYLVECQNITRIRELETMIESYSSMVERNTRQIEREKERVETLLLNIMPRAAYEEQKNFGVVTPQRFDPVAVLQLDFVDFSALADALAPATFVGELNELYSAFDQIGDQFGLERIKTTGDSYLCVAGLHGSERAPAIAAANAAQRFLRYLARRNENAETVWRARIGIGTGPVVGSVIGVRKYVYDLFGRAVNAASDMRKAAGPMEAVLDAATVSAIDGALPLSQPEGESAKAASAMALSIKVERNAT